MSLIIISLNLRSTNLILLLNRTDSDLKPVPVEKSPGKDERSEQDQSNDGHENHPNAAGVESKRSSIVRRKVSVLSSAPEGETEKVPEKTSSTDHPQVLEYKVYSIGAVANIVLDSAMNFLMNGEDRSRLLSQILPTLQAALMNATENFMEGESGKRGERVVLAATILFFLIIVGVGNRLLFYLVQMVMYLVATGLMLGGVSMLLNAVWELKDHFSLLLPPSPGNKVVTTGVYQLVRHPMYCGVIMLAFGWSISQQQIYKMVLSMILFVVLVRELPLLLHPLQILWWNRIMPQRKKKNISRRSILRSLNSLFFIIDRLFTLLTIGLSALREYEASDHSFSLLAAKLLLWFSEGFNCDAYICISLFGKKRKRQFLFIFSLYIDLTILKNR